MDFESLTLAGAEWTLELDDNGKICEVSLHLPASWYNMLFAYIQERAHKKLSEVIGDPGNIRAPLAGFSDDLAGHILCLTTHRFYIVMEENESLSDVLSFSETAFDQDGKCGARKAVLEALIEECQWDDESFTMELLRYTYDRTRMVA